MYVALTMVMALINHHAKYHEACRLIFNNTKLQRAQKRRCPSEKGSADQSTSSKFTRKTTSVAVKEVEPELVQCFFCEKFVGRSEVREAMTMQLNDRLNQCAQNLQAECMRCYCTGTQISCWLFDCIIQPRKVSIENLVLAELVTHIVETQRQSPSVAVFKLSDLCTLYQNRLQQQGSPLKLNRTRLENRILS